MQQKTMQVIEDDWECRDGTVVRRKRWMPGDEPRAWVIALHGLNCIVDDIAPLAVPLTEAGIALAAWNLRGQGLDPVGTRRGARLDVSGMIADVQTMLADPEFEGAPVFLAGDSMGAMLALRAAIDPVVVARISGLLMFVPIAALARRNPPWIKSLLRWLSRRFPLLRVNANWLVHGKSTSPQLTRDPARQASFENAPHRMPRLSPGFLCEMGDLIEGTVPAATKLRVPTVMFTAGHDAFVRPEDSEALFRAIAAEDKTHVAYPASCHQLLHDWDAAAVARDAVEWIAARLAK